MRSSSGLNAQSASRSTATPSAYAVARARAVRSGSQPLWGAVGPVSNVGTPNIATIARTTHMRAWSPATRISAKTAALMRSLASYLEGDTSLETLRHARAAAVGGSADILPGLVIDVHVRSIAWS